MKAPKWTPGPWRMDLSGVESKHQRVCDVLASSLAERNANAHLIAAAPMLYAELERLVGLLAETSNYLGPFDHADRFAMLRAGVLTGRRTLAKARGEP